MTETEDEKWMRIRKLYDEIDRERRLTPSRSSLPKLTSDEARELSPEAPRNVAYQLNVMNSLDFYYEGCTRHNLNSSNEHIAHVVLRCHEQLFEWKKIPFKPRCYIYNDVWAAMVRKVQSFKDAVYEEREMFGRYDGRTD